LTIQLDRVYNREEEYTINIDYTAKPNELSVEGSVAISEAKGLYFINPTGEEDKPQQIWTQGETEASSCWFPTIDRPNERMTQNIAITVKDEFVTLSNGLLVKSVKNEDGTRTDFWEQKLAHVPYLAMLAVGDFNITTDRWKDINVDYYLEDDYHQYARSVFGKTPQMIAHFSEVLGVEYPWEKYAQIVVRDFVSGAMENTTAVIHGEFVQMTDRELLDDHQDDIIAHELFHHWFGDLVTCESWANLPLNESFATYGEYIWREKGFGRLEADMHLDADLNNYLRESQRKQVDMIRFDYNDKEDMFDSHSYAKGGRILHMLRYYLGDDAFYNGLKKYLNDNAFNTVEIHQLRIAMEAVCGEDLNWFFNQWFFASGHPLLVVDYNYDADKKQLLVSLEQIQEQSTTPIYRLSFYIDVYENGIPKRHLVEMTEQQHDYYFDVDQKPSNVIVDAEHVLLAEIFDEKPDEWWLEQMHSPLYMDSKIALENISDKNSSNGVLHALNNNFWGIRLMGVNKANTLENIEEVLGLIEQQAKSDVNTKVKSAALTVLSQLDNKKEYGSLFESSISERSPLVASAGLGSLAEVDSQKALTLAPQFEDDLSDVVGEIYANYGGAEKAAYFQNQFEGASGYDLYYLTGNYVTFLKNQELSTILEGVPTLEKVSKEAKSWMVRVSQYYLNDIKATIDKKSKTEKDKEIKKSADETLERIEALLK
jgi:aminopeptidase N